jgi:hypothetical protein
LPISADFSAENRPILPIFFPRLIFFNGFLPAYSSEYIL